MWSPNQTQSNNINQIVTVISDFYFEIYKNWVFEMWSH